MKFLLEIDCGNAAFSDDASAEVARILVELARKVDGSSADPVSSFVLHDINGNRVGEAGFKVRHRRS